MKISVCIATYGPVFWSVKASQWAFPSALHQGAYEVLLHEDGSLALARNGAARLAEGDWLCFLDADDKLDSGYIKAMKAADEAEGDALLVPRVRYWRQNNDLWVSGEPVFPNRNQPIEDMNHCVIGTLVPKRLFELVGGFGDEPIYEDWALWLKCLRAGARLVYVEDAIYDAFVRDDGRNSQTDMALDTYNRIRSQHLELTR